MAGDLRRVFLQGCARLADELSNDGFERRRSGQTLVRAVGDLTFEISLGSSHYNSPDYVALRIAAQIRSKALRAWRKKRGDGDARDQVLGCYVGFLLGRDASLEWDLGREGSRESQLSDALATLRRHVLPHFGRFEDIAGLPHYLAELNLAWAANLTGPLEFFVARGRADLARTYVSEIMRVHDITDDELRAGLNGQIPQSWTPLQRDIASLAQRYTEIAAGSADSDGA